MVSGSGFGMLLSTGLFIDSTPESDHVTETSESAIDEAGPT